MFKKPKQIRVKYIGGLKTLISRCTFYIGILNFLMLAATSYTVVVKGIIDVPFWVFLLGMVVVVLVAMIFEYTIMLPSELSFTNWQTYEHDNPIRRDLEEIKEKLKEIEKK